MQAIGPCIDLSAFAESTWQAPTPRAYAIKQAFVEVEHMTGCKSMRRMRGDHYGILRAALFQMVMKRLPVPRADHAIECISRDMQRGNLWVREWTFGHRLPYGAENVMQGICQCLSSLDQLVCSFLVVTFLTFLFTWMDFFSFRWMSCRKRMIRRRCCCVV